jgi:hypothetical protein
MSFELTYEQIEELKRKLNVYKDVLKNPDLSQHYKKIKRAISDLETFYLIKDNEITVDGLIDLKNRFKLKLTTNQEEHVVFKEFQIALDKFKRIQEKNSTEAERFLIEADRLQRIRDMLEENHLKTPRNNFNKTKKSKKSFKTKKLKKSLKTKKLKLFLFE